MTYTFSVIIPLYNKADYIRVTLESVLAQSYSSFEIIIVNDGSTDNSLEIAKETLRGFRNSTFISQENKGLSATRNLGISLAKGTIIALLDADDIWHRNYLKTIYSLYQKFPETSYYGSCYTEMIGNKHLLRPKMNIKNSLRGRSFIIDDFFKLNTFQNIVQPSSFAFKKSVSEAVKYDERITFSEDIDFYIRCFTQNNLAYSFTESATIRSYIPNQMNYFGISNKTITNLDAYENLAKNSISLKRFLDIKRYHYASQYKLNNDIINMQKTLKHIDYNSLTKRQKILLKSPLILHKLVVKLKKLLIRNNIRLTSY